VIPDQYLAKLSVAFPPTLMKEVNVVIAFKPGRQTEVGLVSKDKPIILETITDAMQFRRSAGFIRRILKNDETEKGIDKIRNFLFRTNLSIPQTDRAKFSIKEEFRNSFAQAKTWVSNLSGSRDIIAKNYSSDAESNLYKDYLLDQTLRIESAIVKFVQSFISPWEKKSLQKCMLEEKASIFLFDKLAKNKVQLELSRPAWKVLFPANTPKGMYITLEESRDEKFRDCHRLVLTRSIKLIDCYSEENQSKLLPEKEEKYLPNLKLGEALRKFRIVVVPTIDYKTYLIGVETLKQLNALPQSRDFPLYSKINQAELDFFMGRIPFGFNSKLYWKTISGKELKDENPQTGGFRKQVLELKIPIPMDTAYPVSKIRHEYLTKFLSGLTDTDAIAEVFRSLCAVPEREDIKIHVEQQQEKVDQKEDLLSFSKLTIPVDQSQRESFQAFINSGKMSPYQNKEIKERKSSLTPNSKLTKRSRQIVDGLRKISNFQPLIESIQDFLQSFVSLNIQTAAAEQIYATQNRFYYDKPSTEVDDDDEQDNNLDPLPEVE